MKKGMRFLAVAALSFAVTTAFGQQGAAGSQGSGSQDPGSTIQQDRPGTQSGSQGQGQSGAGSSGTYQPGQQDKPGTSTQGTRSQSGQGLGSTEDKVNQELTWMKSEFNLDAEKERRLRDVLVKYEAQGAIGDANKNKEAKENEIKAILGEEDYKEYKKKKDDKDKAGKTGVSGQGAQSGQGSSGTQSTPTNRPASSGQGSSSSGMGSASQGQGQSSTGTYQQGQQDKPGTSTQGTRSQSGMGMGSTEDKVNQELTWMKSEFNLDAEKERKLRDVLVKYEAQSVTGDATKNKEEKEKEIKAILGEDDYKVYKQKKADKDKAGKTGVSGQGAQSTTPSNRPASSGQGSSSSGSSMGSGSEGSSSQGTRSQGTSTQGTRSQGSSSQGSSDPTPGR